MNDGRKRDGQERGRPSIEDDHNNRSSISPAHWQGEPLPRDAKDQTQELPIDQRGPGRARQYGRAGQYGEAYNESERRPQRGEKQPDDMLLEDVRDVFYHSGLNVADVNVKVENGVVCLGGYVEDNDDKYVLERLAVNCHGTIAVESKLTARPTDDETA